VCVMCVLCVCYVCVVLANTYVIGQLSLSSTDEDSFPC